MEILEFLAQSRTARLAKFHLEFPYAKYLMPEFWLEVMRPAVTPRERLQSILLLAKARGRDHLSTEDYHQCREQDLAELILPELEGYELYVATREARKLQKERDRSTLSRHREMAGPLVWVLPADQVSELNAKLRPQQQSHP